MLANGQGDGARWSNLSLYVDGDRIAYSPYGSWTSVPSGYAWLYLGWDEASGSSPATAGRFKGVVDEFRLYARSLSPDAVRGLMWFLRGSNSIIVPRGVLYDSKLFAKMTDPSSDLMTGPLAGATVHANTNGGSAHLNSRVIQMVIDKNLTLEDAYRLLGLLWTNKTGIVTAFAMFAAREFYTLGFAWQVAKLVANASVVNSGDYGDVAPPPPPREWWEAAWNAIAGVAQFVWNAVVAVATFVVAAVVWLANVAIGLAIGLTTGNWDYFEQNVVEPFKKALEAFVQFIVDFVNAIIQAAASLFKPLLDAVGGWRFSVQGSFAMERQASESGGPSRAPSQTANVLMSGAGFQLASVIVAFVETLIVIVGVLALITFGLMAAVAKAVGEFVVNLLKAAARSTIKNIDAILSATVAALLTTVFISFIDFSWPGTSEALSDLTPWISLAVVIGSIVFQRSKGVPLVKALLSDAFALVLSIVGLLAGGLLGLLLTLLGFWWAWVEDDFIDKLPFPRVVTLFEEVITLVDMGATLYQFIEENRCQTPRPKKDTTIGHSPDLRQFRTA